jgi:DNA polymerase-1
MTKRLVIIDGKSVFYRGYYAMPNLSTKDGTPTGGVYGFATMALEVVKKLKPNYICVAWDKRHTNIRLRREWYPEYKGNRKAAPPDFYEQVEILHKLLQALGWPLYEIDDYEADDIMGAFAKQAGAKDIESYLVTSDLDVLQLVNPHTHIYTLKKGVSNIELFNVASFEEKYGVGAHQWVDVKALKGDSSDNIPGVGGVGEKTALELIKKYETLDGVYAHLDELKPALRTKLENDRDMAYLSKKLVTLIVDMPLEIDLEKAKLHDGVTPEFAAILRKLEFKNLLRQVESQLSREEVVASESPTTKISVAKKVAFKPEAFVAGSPRILASNPEMSEIWVSADGTHFSAFPLEVEQTSLLAVPGDKNSKDILREAIKTLANGPIVGHDLKPILRGLMARELDWPGEVAHDTKLGAFLLNSLQRSRELSDLCEQTIDTTDGGVVVGAIWQLYQQQRGALGKMPKLQKLAHDVDFPMVKLLATIEHRGMVLDVQYLQSMSKKFAERITEFEQKIYELAGQEFTIGSPQQLSKILFEKLALPTKDIKKGKTGYSTGATELAKLQGLHPIVALIGTWREYTKLQNTYIEALPKLVDAKNRLHTTFTLDVAATGRLSSLNPNLQNIPIRTDIGRAIRSAFVPRPGNVFVSADYNQFELRLSAVMADDKELINDFNNDVDVHTKTAAQVYGVPMEQVDKNMRRRAKVVNFGILYGMSPHGLSAAANMTYEEAREFIRKYFELRVPIREYMEHTVEEAKRVGYVETIFGRRRPTPDLQSSNFAVREAARRVAINMPIQGTEADLMKMAMLKVEKELEGIGEQLLQIHDSILVETPTANAEKVAKILKETMENIYKLPVRLNVDVTTGKDWGEL